MGIYDLYFFSLNNWQSGRYHVAQCKSVQLTGFVNLNNRDDKLFIGEGGKKDEKYWRGPGVSEV